MKNRIFDLCEKAELNKPNSEFEPERYTSFVWMRATGSTRVSAAEDLSVSDRTLERWEKKVRENLELDELAELVVSAVDYEYEQRFGDSSSTPGDEG